MIVRPARLDSPANRKRVAQMKKERDKKNTKGRKK